MDAKGGGERAAVTRRRGCGRTGWAVGLAVVLAGGLGLPVAAQLAQSEQELGAKLVDNPGPIHVLPVRHSEKFGEVYLLTGAGANITAVMSGEGVVLVDAGTAAMADEVLATLQRLTAKQVWAIINTSVDPDKTGGVPTIAQAGNNVARGLNEPGAQVLAHENVLTRLSNLNAPLERWPTDTYFVNRWTLPSLFYGDGIQIMHFPAGHTDGDSVVWFRHADVIATGDVFRTDIYPVIDLAQGGNVQGVLDALNWVLDTAITSIRAEGGTLVIPGHGRLCDRADVSYYRDMVTIVRDRVKDEMAKGKTLAEIQASRPTADYDPRYGTTTGPWTTTMFVEAVYRSLMTPAQTAENR